MEVGKRIKEWRHALGLTQDEFARRSGIPKRTIVGYENCEREPGSKALAAIAKTGVNMTWLLTGEGEMRAQTRAESTVYDGPHARRWEKIIALVEGIEDETRRSAVLDELFSLAQKESELDALRKTVADLKKRITP